MLNSFYPDIPKENRFLDLVIIEANEKQYLEIVIEVFHSGTYLAVQNGCRKIYEPYFAFDNYFKEKKEVLKKRYS